MNKPATITARYIANDSLGNTFKITVKSNGSVTGTNQAGIPTSLSNYGGRGIGARERAEDVADAAREGLDRLNQVSFHIWRPL